MTITFRMFLAASNPIFFKRAFGLLVITSKTIDNEVKKFQKTL